MAYNPQGYVPGGSSARVARAIQQLAMRKRAATMRPLPPGQAAMGRGVGVGMRPRGTVNMDLPGLGRVLPQRHDAANRGVDPLLTAANKQVTAMNAPLLAQLAQARAQAEAQARAQYAQHIQGLEKGLMATAAPIAGAYGAAQQSSAATEAALAAKLRGEGDAAGQSLAAKLAQINAPGQNPVTAQVAQTYQGAGNAGFASGSADLQHLIARGAEANSYQAKLPGFARMEGERALQGVLADQRKAATEQDTELTSQATQNAFELWQEAKKQKADVASNKAEAIENEKDRAAKEKLALQALYATATTKGQQLQVQKEMKDADRRAKLAIAQLNADVRVATDNPTKPDKVTGAANQKFITVGGQAVPNPNYVPPSSKTSGGNTASQVRLKRNKATNDINKILFNPMTQKQRQWVTNIPEWNSLVPTINASISNAGLDPNSPAGIALRKNAFKRLGVPTGAKGNPTDKKRATP